MAVPVPGRIVEALRRSTVQIHVQSEENRCAGSGIIVESEAVITNAHVIRRSRTFSVGDWDGAKLPARLVTVDSRRDLALLAVPGLNGAPVTFGDSRLVKSGMPVAALGHPLGFVGALSSGVIHSTPRASLHPNGLALDWICADIRLAPGNSGGPLVDLNGHLLGVNTMVISGALALAVPSRAVEAFIKRTRQGPRLGATLRQVQLPNGSSGLLILEIDQNSAAEAASLLPADILVAAGAVPVQTADDLQLAMDGAIDGFLPVAFLRGDLRNARRVTVKLEQAVRSAA